MTPKKRKARETFLPLGLSPCFFSLSLSLSLFLPLTLTLASTSLLPPKILSLLPQYLNDVAATAGGSTRFPLLKDSAGAVLEIRPVKGTAVIWSNIREDGTIDPRVVHEGVAVESGEKYGMNLWVTD